MIERGPLASEAADEERRKFEALRREQYDSDLRTLMELPVGRRFMARLLEDTTGMLSLSFSTDAAATAFNEGKRSIGIFLANECRRVSAREYVLMQQEQFEEALRQERNRDFAERQAQKEE